MTMKRCPKCKQEKPLSAFCKDRKTKDGLSVWCKTCKSEYYRENREERLAYDAKYKSEHIEERRVYNTKYLEEHAEERAEYASKYYKEHAEELSIYRRDWHLRNKYGINTEQYSEMFESQNGLCAICGKPPEDDRPLYVDHNHITGRIRGLLCSGCNKGLGFFQDNLEVLQSAVEYMIKEEYEREE